MFPIPLRDYMTLFNIYSRLITNYINNGNDMEARNWKNRAEMNGLKAYDFFNAYAKKENFSIADYDESPVPSTDSFYDEYLSGIVNCDGRLYSINLGILVDNDKFESYSFIAKKYFRDAPTEIYSVFNPINKEGADKYLYTVNLFAGLFDLSSKNDEGAHHEYGIVAELFTKILYDIKPTTVGFLFPSDFVEDCDGNNFCKEVINDIIDHHVDFTGKYVKLPVNDSVLFDLINYMVTAAR